MKINLANIKKARNLLNKRECVAIPTETVYGIAGNAYSDTACKKIFRLKKRPYFIATIKFDFFCLVINLLKNKFVSFAILFNFFCIIFLINLGYFFFCFLIYFFIVHLKFFLNYIV